MADIIENAGVFALKDGINGGTGIGSLPAQLEELFFIRKEKIARRKSTIFRTGLRF